MKLNVGCSRSSFDGIYGQEQERDTRRGISICRISIITRRRTELRGSGASGPSMIGHVRSFNFYYFSNNLPNLSRKFIILLLALQTPLESSITMLDSASSTRPRCSRNRGHRFHTRIRPGRRPRRGGRRCVCLARNSLLPGSAFVRRGWCAQRQ